MNALKWDNHVISYTEKGIHVFISRALDFDELSREHWRQLCAALCQWFKRLYHEGEDIDYKEVSGVRPELTPALVDAINTLRYRLSIVNVLPPSGETLGTMLTRRAIEQSRKRRPGAVAVELAVCAPILAIIILGMIDVALACNQAAQLNNAVMSAGLLASTSKDNANVSTLQAYVGADFTIVSVDIVQTSYNDARGDPVYTATITATTQYAWITPGVDPTITRRLTVPITNHHKHKGE